MAVTQMNDKIDMMMFELDNEDCSKRLLPPADDQFLYFSKKVVEAAAAAAASGTGNMRHHPLGIQLGFISPFSFLKKSSNNNNTTTRKQTVTPITQKKEYIFHDQFHKRNYNVTASLLVPNNKHSPSLDKLIHDVFLYIDTCPDQEAYSDDLRKLILKLKE